ncbi:MAG: hypothetical protein M3R04_03275 [bacterium]|nr:hypothetical protein [bacterium]
MFYLRTVLAALMLSALMPLAAMAQGDSYSERYNLDIHMGGFMDRLYNVLTDPKYGCAKYPEVPEVAGLLKQLGYFELENVQCEYAVQDGEVALRWATHFDGLDPQSYFGQVFALPNKPLELATYVPDDALLYVGMNNVPQQALLAVRELGAVAAAAQGEGSGLGEMFQDADLAQVLGMLEAFDVEGQVNQVLTGEVGLAMFAAPSIEKISSGDFGPQDIDAALLIGVKDAARIKQLIGMAGANAQLTSMGEMAGGWSGWYISMPEAAGAGIMMNDKLMFVAPNVQNAVAHLDFSGAGQTTPDCQSYMDINLTRLHDELAGPGLSMLMGEAPVDLAHAREAANYLFALPPSDALGHVRAVTVYDSGYECALTMNTALANYLFYYVGVGAAGMAASEMEKKDEAGAGEEGGE